VAVSILNRFFNNCHVIVEPVIGIDGTKFKIKSNLSKVLNLAQSTISCHNNRASVRRLELKVENASI
jgi:hypothetical protein